MNENNSSHTGPFFSPTNLYFLEDDSRSEFRGKYLLDKLNLGIYRIISVEKKQRN